MGFNSAIMILNDKLHEIERDPDFGAKVSSAVGQHMMGYPHQTHEFDHQSLVLGQQHADVTTVMAMGGNTGFVLGFGGGRLYRPELHNREDPYPRFSTPADGWDRVTLLKQLADDLGYDLRRKRGGKK